MVESPPLAELLQFPCDYLFKAFGPGADGEAFVHAVRAAVTSVVPVPLDNCKVRPSSGGRYQCVTVLVRLHSETQLLAIYTALRQVENLHYLL